MSHYNVKPIRLDFKPSVRLFVLLACAALVSCAIVLYLPIQPSLEQTFGHSLGQLLNQGVKLGAVILILLTLRYHGLSQWQRTPQACKALYLDSKGAWQLECADGSVHAVTILPTSFVAPYLTILHYRRAGRWSSRAVVIVPDAVDAEAYRRLRVWLRWGYQDSGDETAGA
ncbi:MAG TPA: protein YgfX [Methylophilaceae bacterium]|nr:protein YgfX [Methylophilaceae bacterium]